MTETLFLLVAVLGSILVSMTLHEAMHAFAGYWLGDDTARLEGRLTLNPLKHIDPFLTVLLPLSLVMLNLSSLTSGAGLPIIGAAKPVPFNPNRVKYEEYGAALVGLAGPLTNLVLAVAAAGLVRLLGVNFVGLVRDMLVVFIQVNVGFFIFNMIPLPPLDGSRLLYAFAPEPLQDLMARLEQAGFAVILLILLVLVQVAGPMLGRLNSGLLNFLL